MQLPQPAKFSRGCTRWPLSALEAAEAQARGEVRPRASEREVYLSVKQVARRYGVSVPTIWRWCAESRAQKGETV